MSSKELDWNGEGEAPMDFLKSYLKEIEVEDDDGGPRQGDAHKQPDLSGAMDEDHDFFPHLSRAGLPYDS